MDRSRRGTGKQAAAPRAKPPAASRLTVKARPNRRLKTGSIWSRLPRPPVIADACGRALRRSLPVVIGASVVAAVGTTAWAGYRFVTTSERFAVTSIEVRGNQQVATDVVLAAVPVRLGQNVFATSLDSIEAEVRQNPWVANVDASRELPHTIVVRIREHVPAAVVELGGLYLVDGEGHPFKRAEVGSDDGAGLPIITGLERTSYVADPLGTATSIKSALGALTRWRSASDRPSIGEVHLDTHGGLTLVTYENAVTIQLGPLSEGGQPALATTAVSSLDQRMQTFDAIWSELSPGERARARSIHLDARPDRVTVALHPSALAKDS